MTRIGGSQARVREMPSRDMAPPRSGFARRRLGERAGWARWVSALGGGASNCPNSANSPPQGPSRHIASFSFRW